MKLCLIDDELPQGYAATTSPDHFLVACRENNKIRNMARSNRRTCLDIPSLASNIQLIYN